MLRKRRPLIALLAALLLASLQLHAVLHLDTHRHADAKEAPCAVCVEGLQQQSLEAPAAVQAAQAPTGFSWAYPAAIGFQPKSLCSSTLFRGPPAA